MSLDAKLTLKNLGSDFAVDAYHHVDELSELFETTVEFLSTNAEIDLAEALGAEAALTLKDEDAEITFTGLACEAEQLTHVPGALSRYRLRIVPAEWLATKRRNTRIFQHLSIPEIIDEVYGFLGEGPAKKLSETYEPREYTVQYQESDDTFVKRLAAEVGIGFFFDHGNASRMTLFDDSRAELAGKRTAPFRAQRLGHEAREAHVQAARSALKLAAGKLSLRDFDHDKPALDLGTAHPASKPLANEAALEIYEHDVGTYKSESKGKAAAARMLEELRARADTMHLLASFPAPPGTELTLKEHPRDQLNKAFLVLRSEHSVRFGDVAENRVHVAPKDVRFRPERLSKPRIHGSQTAIVVGEDGEEIDVDDQGRVCVAFHWDRREKSAAPTRRLRVSQAWAGPGYGVMMLPRIGDEVIVSYLDGDPDEPLVVGRVHNGTAPPPLKLPGEKTRSIWQSKSTPNAEGHNHIIMEDQAGAELLDVRAQRDLNMHAERNASVSVGKAASENIGTTHTQTVGSNQTVGVGGSQGVNVSGDRSITAGGALTETSASHSIKSGPISMQGTVIGANAAALIAATAPVVSLHGDATVVATAPIISLSASGEATMSAPLAVVDGAGVAVLKGGAVAVVNSVTVSISAAGAVMIQGGGSVTVSAPHASVSGSVVDVSGGTVNVSGSGAVNVTGGTVAIN